MGEVGLEIPLDTTLAKFREWIGNRCMLMSAIEMGELPWFGVLMRVWQLSHRAENPTLLFVKFKIEIQATLRRDRGVGAMSTSDKVNPIFTFRFLRSRTVI
jgi:hypothetical protein